MHRYEQSCSCQRPSRAEVGQVPIKQRSNLNIGGNGQTGVKLRPRNRQQHPEGKRSSNGGQPAECETAAVTISFCSQAPIKQCPRGHEKTDPPAVRVAQRWQTVLERIRRSQHIDQDGMDPARPGLILAARWISCALHGYLPRRMTGSPGPFRVRRCRSAQERAQAGPSRHTHDSPDGHCRPTGRPSSRQWDGAEIGIITSR